MPDARAAIAITGEDRTGQAFASVSRNLSGLEKSVSGVQTVFDRLATFAGAAAIVSFARHAIDSAAALNDMAEATGASVEGLSRIQQVAARTGEDFGQVQGALTRLQRTLSPFSADSKAAALALGTIGLSIDQLRSMRPDQQFEAIARALYGFADGAGKTQVALALLGKTGSEYLPLLKKLGEDQQTLSIVTEQQAEDAERLQKEWHTLSAEATALATTVALKLVPAFNDLVTAMKSGGLLAGLSAGTANYFGADLEKRMDTIRQKLADIQSKRNTNSIYSGGIFGWGLDKEEEHLRATLNALNAIQLQQSKAAQPAAGGQKTIDPNQIAQALKDQEEAEKRAAEAERERQRAGREAAARAAQEWEQGLKVFDDVFKTSLNDLSSLWEKRMDELDQYGVSGSKQYLRFFREDLEFEKSARAELARERERDAEKAADAERKAADDAARAWQKTNDDISNSLTDALLRGFESGKDFAANFADTLRNLFSTLILRPIIQPIAQGLAGGLMSAIGLGTGTGSSAGGLLNLGSSISSLWGGGSLSTALIGGPVSAIAEGLGATTGMATGIGAFASTAIPYVGLALAAASALGLFGGDGPAQRTSRYQANLGQDWPHAYQGNQWFSGSMNSTLQAFTTQRAQQEQKLIDSMGLTAEQIAKVNQALQATAGKSYGFGTEGEQIPQETFTAIEQDRLKAIADALGKSLEDIAAEMDGSAKALRDQQDALKQQAAATWASAARTVAEERLSLAGGDLSPADPLGRLQEAGGAFSEQFRRAVLLGDQSAYGALSSSASGYLQQARSYWASGPEYSAAYGRVQKWLEEAQNAALQQADMNDLVTETKLGNQANEAGLSAMLGELKSINVRLASIANTNALAAAASPRSAWA